MNLNLAEGRIPGTAIHNVSIRIFMQMHAENNDDIGSGPLGQGMDHIAGDTSGIEPTGMGDDASAKVPWQEHSSQQ